MAEGRQGTTTVASLACGCRLTPMGPALPSPARGCSCYPWRSWGQYGMGDTSQKKNSLCPTNDVFLCFYCFQKAMIPGVIKGHEERPVVAEKPETMNS